MSNTLTNLIPAMFAGLDEVSREQAGYVRAVSRNSSVERAALDQTVYVPIAPAVSTAANTAAVSAPDTGDNTMTTASVSITASKHVAIRFNGEEVLGLKNAGNYDDIVKKRFAQGFRALVNEIEAAIYAAAYKKSSRAYGTAGTAPFGTAADLSDLAQARKILEDNGAPTSSLKLVLSNAAAANLRGKQSSLFKVNEAGSDDLLREGRFGRLEGFDLFQSGQASVHTKGTGSGYLVNDATPPAVGDVSITTDTGSGTIVAGDVITLAGDSNKYVVNTALASNVVVINEPGLQVAADDNDAITVGNDYTANLAFADSAIVLATRMPALPLGGDMASDRMTVQDPVSGLAFEVAEYRQFRQTVYHIAIAYGVAAIKQEHIATILG